MSFHDIAHIYDCFNDLSVYSHWLDFTLNSLDQAPESALDLACGTGFFTQLLAPFIDHIIGVDIDANMIQVATQETEDVPNVHFEQGDMLHLKYENNSFDLVTCYLDSLCFLPDYPAVQQALKEIYRVLKPGGIVLIDVWTSYQIREGFDGFSYFDYDDSAALMWESEVDQEQLAVSHFLTVFEAVESVDDTTLYKRTDVKLEERTYALETYQEAFGKAGFNAEKVEVLVDFGTNNYDSKQPNTNRWFFRTTK